MAPRPVLRASPLAPGLAAELRCVAKAFAHLLEPLRRTRPHGHEALRTLLRDPASRAALVDHLAQMSEFAVQLPSYCRACQVEVEGWRREYRQAAPEQRAQLRAACQPRKATALLASLHRLYNEAHADMEQLLAFAPELFLAPAQS